MRPHLRRTRPPPVLGDPLSSGGRPHSFRKPLTPSFRWCKGRRATRGPQDMHRLQADHLSDRRQGHVSTSVGVGTRHPAAPALAAVAARPGATAASASRRLEAAVGAAGLPEVARVRGAQRADEQAFSCSSCACPSRRRCAAATRAVPALGRARADAHRSPPAIADCWPCCSRTRFARATGR